MKKLIVVDVDGTLINKKGELTQKTKNALLKVQEQGHKVVISSGRSQIGVLHYAKELKLDIYGGYIANFNGAVVTDMKTEKAIIDHRLEIEESKEIMKFAESVGLDYMVYFEDKVYTPKKDIIRLYEILSKNDRIKQVVIEDLSNKIDFKPNNILFSEEPGKIEGPALKIKEKYGNDYTTIYSTPYFYELMPKNVSKGQAMLEIADILGIDYSNTIAFGDQQNDLSMIEKAGCGVAMGNAVEELKQKSDFITLSNDEDGIAIYLEKNILE